MPSYATLDLSKPMDAIAWQKGCESLGFTSAVSIVNPSPTLADLESFFRSQPDCVYFSGHISGTSLYGEGDAQVQFKTDRVANSTNSLAIKYDKNARNLLKEDSEFAMHKNCLLVILGGCSALESPSTVKIIRELFFNPIILGYSAQCGWQINEAMLGGGFIRPHFFANVRSGETIVNAWLQSALWGYHGTSMESMFRAVDQDGQEWKLVASKIVKGWRV